MTELQALAHTVSWAPLIFCVSSIIPQMYKNYRLQSTQGLSPIMIFLFYSGTVASAIYMHLLNLPISYRTMISIQVLFVTTLVFQEYYYSKDEERRNNIMLWHSFATFIGTLGIVASFWFPQQIGLFSGWAAFFIFSVCQVPQIIKNYQRKSIRGLSLLFVSFLTLASITEIAVGIVLQVPLPTIMNASRGLIYYTIYFGQFFLYGSRDPFFSNL